MFFVLTISGCIALRAPSERQVNTISRQIRGEAGEVPQHLTAVIRAWEIMSEAQWKAWLEGDLN